jgi:(p)ppGpp synthase/HD superfamily hydrolase
MISEQHQKAIEFAAMAHAGQMRKKTTIPYISHPYIVATILQQQGCDEHVVIAGVLHDTVEDTPTTIEEIRREFGAPVADIVAAVTEPSKSLSWEYRKNYMIDSIKTASPEVKFVVCADKLHNLSSIKKAFAEIGDAVWDRFKRGYEAQKWYGESMLAGLFYGLKDHDQKPMFFELAQIVEELYYK